MNHFMTQTVAYGCISGHMYQSHRLTLHPHTHTHRFRVDIKQRDADKGKGTCTTVVMHTREPSCDHDWGNSEASEGSCPQAYLNMYDKIR